MVLYCNNIEIIPCYYPLDTTRLLLKLVISRIGYWNSMALSLYLFNKK